MWRWAQRRIGVAALLVAVGCSVGRYVRIQQKGLTCTEAQRIAIDAVRRMGYTISDTTKATPNAAGVIVAARTDGTTKRGMLVSVFCTTLGAEVEAKSEQGGLAQLDFSNEFRRSFEAAAKSQPPPRAAAERGVDVLVTLERDGGLKNLGVDLSGLGILPVSVRITNRTARTYRVDPKYVVLQTAAGDRAHPLKLPEVTAHAAAVAAPALQRQALGARDLAPNDSLTGFLFFPFNSYVRARVELIDRSSDEAEGFSIEF